MPQQTIKTQTKLLVPNQTQTVADHTTKGMWLVMVLAGKTPDVVLVVQNQKKAGMGRSIWSPKDKCQRQRFGGRVLEDMF